jgi:hypothetical protein
MITNTGKNIIAKYLIGNAPAYASFVALGCGARPRPNVNEIVGVQSSGTTVTVLDNTGIFVGAKIDIVDGDGQLSGVEDTIVTSVTSSSAFEIFPEPVVPLNNATISIQADPQKPSLDFEMFRVPILSRGYINDNGVNKVIFTAQLPTEERYEISEIGIFSAGSNSAAGRFDSRVLFSFTQDEAWQHHTVSSAVNLPSIFIPLDSGDDDVIDVAPTVFQTSASNRIFTSVNRLSRYEQLRYLNNIVMMQGNDANLTTEPVISNIEGDGTTVTVTTTAQHNIAPGDTISISGVDPSAYNLLNAVVTSTPQRNVLTITDSATGSYVGGGKIEMDPNNTHLFVTPGSNHIHLFGANPDLSGNSTSDLIKLAFCVINKNGSFAGSPDSVKILIEAASNDIPGEGEYARFEIDVKNGTGPGEFDLANNRYVVVSKELRELYLSENFSWNVVNVLKIYATAEVSGQPSSDYYIAFDGIRVDNIASPNPLYGMTGYSIVQNTDAVTIRKLPNTNNFVEFRFVLDVT